MFDWLFEGKPTVYLLLGVLGLILLVLWWRSRKKALLAGVVVVALLALIVFLLSILVPTDRKQIDLSVREMAEGVRVRDLNRSFAQISEEFRRGDWNKRTLRQHADNALANLNIKEIRTWDFEVDEVKRDGNKGTAKVHFSVKVVGEFPGSDAFYICRAEYMLDGDGKWRMRTFDLFNPAVNADTPVALPF